MSRVASSSKAKAFGVLAAIGFGLLGSCSSVEPDRPSIVLITVDTLRADRLGCYGYPGQTSPHIDAFAREALVFENGLSHAAETCASCASLLSGFLPHETQVAHNCVVSPKIRMLPEILAAEGYATAAVVSNFALRDKQGFEQGFAVYDDRMDDLEINRGWPERIAINTTDRAIELLEQYRDEPLFLWVHYQDPHGPYTPPQDAVEPSGPASSPRPLPVNASPFGRDGIPDYQVLGSNRDFQHYVDRYEGEIRYLDRHVGRLMDTLREHGLYDEALIVFSADHGESLGEHDYFFCHGETLFSDQTHVPLILRYGDRFQGRRPDVVQHVDLVPTVVQLLDLESDPLYRGRSLLEPAAEPSPVLATLQEWEIDGLSASLVQDGFKLIFTSSRGSFELFDLSNDPGETVDLSSDPRYLQTRERLEAGMRALMTEDRLQLGNVEAPELTEEEMEKLRSLGYVNLTSPAEPQRAAVRLPS